MAAKTRSTRTQEGDSRKLDSYLTEMKELPPSEEVSEIASEKRRAESSATPSSLEERQKEKIFSEKEVTEKPEYQQSETLLGGDEEEIEEKEGWRLPLASKDVILGIINLISIVLLVIILFKFPDKAKELKKLRIEDEKGKTNISYELPEVVASKEKAKNLSELFLDEIGIVDFVNKVEEIRGEAGVVTKVSFASQRAIKDKTGNVGLPVVIELTGSWGDIDKTLQKIDKLPFLFRAARVDIERSKDDPSVIVFKYGVFLYVSDKEIAQ